MTLPTSPQKPRPNDANMLSNLPKAADSTLLISAGISMPIPPPKSSAISVVRMGRGKNGKNLYFIFSLLHTPLLITVLSSWLVTTFLLFAFYLLPLLYLHLVHLFSQ